MSEMSCSLWETSSTGLWDTFNFCCAMITCCLLLMQFLIAEMRCYLPWFMMHSMVFDRLSVQSVLQAVWRGYGEIFDLLCSSAVIYWEFFSSSTLMRAEIYCSLSQWVCFWILETSYLHIIICLKWWYEYHSLWFGNNCVIFHRDAEHYLSLAVFMWINDA